MRHARTHACPFCQVRPQVTTRRNPRASLLESLKTDSPERLKHVQPQVGAWRGGARLAEGRGGAARGAQPWTALCRVLAGQHPAQSRACASGLLAVDSELLAVVAAWTGLPGQTDLGVAGGVEAGARGQARLSTDLLYMTTHHGGHRNLFQAWHEGCRKERGRLTQCNTTRIASHAAPPEPRARNNTAPQPSIHGHLRNLPTYVGMHTGSHATIMPPSYACPAPLYCLQDVSDRSVPHITQTAALRVHPGSPTRQA